VLSILGLVTIQGNSSNSGVYFYVVQVSNVYSKVHCTQLETKNKHVCM